MNGIHDMGGMHGFGAVDVADDVAFHEEWERHTRAMFNRVWAAGLIKVDASRRAIEELPPDIYVSSSYFERWLLALEHGLIERGYLTREQIDARMAQLENGYPSVTELPKIPVREELSEQDPRKELGTSIQRFEKGERVRVLNVHSQQHTRSPRYLRGKVGVIQAQRGHEVFPDTNAYYRGDIPQAVYSVTFEGQEVWGLSSEPAQLISIDLWDSYLERA